MRWNATEPSFVSTIILQEVDSLGHEITNDSRQIKMQVYVIE